MTNAAEASTAKTPLASDLALGVKTIDLNQEIEFKLYVRIVLPIDGYVFWVRADLISTPVIRALLTANQVMLGSGTEFKIVVKAQGSLHYSTVTEQAEDSTMGVNRMVFTSLQPIKDFNFVNPFIMYVATFGETRFSFSSRGSFYRQADLYHYLGNAVYSTTATQLIDDPSQFSTKQVVSNSLPGWLGLNNLSPFYGFGNTIPVLPSFLIPQNEPPPYASVHIIPDTTRGLASAPTIDPSTSTHTQLCAETARITLWGLRNDQALDFVDCVYQYSSDVGAFGIMNIPVIRDEKLTQSELQVIGQKKMIDFEVSYLQHRINTIARQQIKHCIPNIFVGGVPLSQ